MFKKCLSSLFLFFLVVTLSAEVRIIPITVVADQHFYAQHIPWKWAAKNIIAEVNVIFADVGIQFEIKNMNTVKIPAHKTKSQTLLFFAQNINPSVDEIAVLLSSKEYDGKILFYEGLAHLNGAHCLVSDNTQFLEECRNLPRKTKKELEKLFAKMLAHELCHLFGVEHNDDPDSLLAPTIKLKTAKMSQLTKEKILARKDVAFADLSKFKDRYYQPEKK